MKRVATTLGLAGVCWLALSAQALAGDWVLLGERAVNFSADRDVIPVTAAEGRFRKIKLTVAENPINMLDLKVHFANGDVQDVAVRAEIPAGGETRVIDLPGAVRTIQKITLIYSTKRGPRRALRGRAVVKVFGLQVEEEVATPQPRIEWVKLGERKVNWSVDRDVIPVTAAEGRFVKVKLKVLENGIHMLDLKVHFANGEVQDVQVRSEIAAGGETRAIDLPGNVRTIQKITLWYRSHGRLLPGRGVVQVFGAKVVGSEGPPPARPQPAAGGWEKLGERVVAFKAEQDTIPVTIREGRFTAIRFKAEDVGIEILDVKVHFANGGVQDASPRCWIPAGGESSVIDLPGEARVIEKVVFFYRTRGVRRGRAHIVLFGRH